MKREMRHTALLQGGFAPLSDGEVIAYRDCIAAALAEDIAKGDITTDAIVETSAVASADIVLRSEGVVAGLPCARLAFALVDPNVEWESVVVDGVRVYPGATVARLRGPARGILTGERVALNFLGRLSGIATLTRQFADAVCDLPVRIADTRKTTPGLRALERYAVRAGGGYNHRFDLSEAVLIKDNHLAQSGSVAEAVARVRARVKPGVIVEVECDTLAQVREAVSCGVDAILLDNMSLERLRDAVKLAKGQAVLEASGGVTPDNVREIALTGVDIISVGALTHGVRSLDVGLDFTRRSAKVSI